MSKNSNGQRIISDNRKARFLYAFLEIYQAGIELLGTEVKSIRAGRVSMQDGYASIRNGEAWLMNVHIAPYDSAGSFFNHEAKRSRRLLLHKKEINQLIGQVEQKGLTLVPTKMYFKNGRVKVDIALARGKKLHDKREDIKRRDDKRAMQRAMKQY